MSPFLDARLEAVQRALCSSRPVVVHMAQEGLSDHDLLDAQQSALKLLALRTMAQAHGRALLTYAQVGETSRSTTSTSASSSGIVSDVDAQATEALTTPPLVLSGRLKGSAVSVAYDAALAAKDTLLWPSFHNGCAAALRLAPVPPPSEEQRVSAAWITYNRPPLTAEAPVLASHAGVLLGLGLNGHLRALTAAKVLLCPLPTSLITPKRRLRCTTTSLRRRHVDRRPHRSTAHSSSRASRCCSGSPRVTEATRTRRCTSCSQYTSRRCTHPRAARY